MSTTLADVLYPVAGAPPPTTTGGEPQSPPSDLTPSSPTASSPGSDDDGTTRKRSASGSIKEGKERTANKICRVCGDKAYSYNFNVITCESCKAFFRRNANKEKEIRCPFNESCEINVVSRRFCQRCRLFKCFQVGMKKEWIMTDEARLEKKARVEENRERRKEEAKRKDHSVESNGSAGSGGGYNHYRTTSVSSGSGKSAAASVAAAAAAVKEINHQQQQQAAAMQHAVAQQHHQLQQHHQQQQALFQPELPLTTNATTTNLLDALAQLQPPPQPQPVQQPFQAAAALPTAAALVAAVAAPPPTSSELVAHAIAFEQQMQQTPFGAPAPNQPTTAATAAAVYQAAAAHHHHQQQQMAAAAAVAQQIVSMTAAAPPAPLDMAAALALQPPATPTSAAAATAAILSAAANASPLGPLTQAALIMDASAAATQQLQQQLAAAAAPPPSALAAVASTMLLEQQQALLQPVTPVLPPTCCCTCKCGKYTNVRTIVEQAKEEWEAERRARRSQSSASDDNMGLSELLPSASGVSWLNPATNQNPLTDGALSSALPAAMAVDDAYSDLHELRDSFISTGKIPAVGLQQVVDLDFGPMLSEDEALLAFVHEANKVWTEAALNEEERAMHKQEIPSKMTMLQMMVGAVKRMISMAKKFPALKKLHSTDQLKLIKGCYLDVMIIRGAMAYDPTQNAWKGPTSQHDYKIKMDAMNDDPTSENMFHQSIRLYSMFKEEYRQNENVMLLLNMIVLFDPNVPELADREFVRRTQNDYKRCLKRFMYTMHNDNQSKVQLEYKSLLDRLATVRKMNSGARGIMEEHADSMDPLLKELLGANDDCASKASSSKRHSPKSVASTSSIDEQPPSNSSRS